MKLDINRGSPDACWTFQIVDSLYKIYLLKKRHVFAMGITNHLIFNIDAKKAAGTNPDSLHIRLS